MATFSTVWAPCSPVSRKVLSSIYFGSRTQIRQYAISSKAGRNGYNGEGDGGGDPNIPSAPREKSIGTFVSMSKGGLTNPLFEPDHRDGLELEMYNPEILTEMAVGQAMQFRVKDTTPFRIFGLPKNILLEFRLLSKPCSVVRDVTLSAIDMLDAANVKSSRETRVVLTGGKGTGKSFTLLQALQYCISRHWIVMYIPRAVTLINSSTPHVYDPRTQTYLQPTMAYQTLQRFLTVNRTALSRLTTANELVLDKKPTVPAGTVLKDLIDVGLKDQSVAPTILSVLLSELEEQTSYPVLLAVDDFQALYCQSTYRDPQYQPIKSYHLSMPRILLEYASGKRSFTRGAVFGAISTTHNSFPIPLELREALNLPHPIPNSPYFKRSAELRSYAKGLRKLEVPPQLSVSEAAGMFEVWMKDRALHSASNDELFMAKYTEASGNPRDFVWRGLLGTLET